MLKGKILYILLYLLILVTPALLVACIHSIGFSYLWENLNIYAIYFGVGIVASFGKEKVRNLALLFQIGTSVYFLSVILGFPLLLYDEAVHRFIIIFLFAFLYYVWAFYYHKLLRYWQIFVALIFSALFNFFIAAFNGPWDLISFIYSHIGFISNIISVILGLLIGVTFSLLKNKWQIWFFFIFAIVISFFSSIYLGLTIRNILIYGSLTGKTIKNVTFSFRDKEKKEFTPKDFEKKYTLLFVWDDHCNLHGEMLTLHNYYWKYKENENVCFYLISMNSSDKNLCEKYDLHSYVVPSYIATDSISFCNELGVCQRHEFVCLLKNDTLIYRNTMLKVGEYLDELIKEAR